MTWLTNINEIAACMKGMAVETNQGAFVEPDVAFWEWYEQTSLLRRNGNTVYIIGNGASASMASHIAADLFKNGGVRTDVFSDVALITAMANDLSYEDVFSEPLNMRMDKGDMLVAISSSGMSPNVIRACQLALERGGYVVTLSAMTKNNRLRTLGGDLNFYLPAMSYGLAETCHAALLHYWVDLIVEAKKNQQAV